MKGCICLCEQKIKWVGTTAGYENLFRHVQAKHSNYVNEVPMLKECEAKNMTQKVINYKKIEYIRFTNDNLKI